MRKNQREHRIGLIGTLVALLVAVCMPAATFAVDTPTPENDPDKFGVISGIVLDKAGKPIANAIVAVSRTGSKKVLRQVRSSVDGKYLLRLLPGTYTVLAVAEGFNPLTFKNVEIEGSAELDYGFKLERAGSGNTLPEKRVDRSNPKWVIRSSQQGRTIYQNSEGDPLIDDTVADAAGTEDKSEKARPGQSIVETGVASTSNGAAYSVNYATLLPVGEKAEVLIAGQAAVGEHASQSIDAQLKFRASDNHTLRLRTAVGNFGGLEIDGRERDIAQFSVSASDEWRVSEGLIFVYGVDYSKFIGAGGDSAVSPRLGLQYDIDHKTRFRSAYTTLTEERTWAREIEFEGAQVAFREPASLPDFVVEDGVASMQRNRRFEFGLERILDSRSTIEANVFFDTTFDRGVGFVTLPTSAAGDEFNEFTGNQTGSAQGLRVVYSRRLSGRFSASGGYSYGVGQQISAADLSDPGELFENAVFHSLFGQFDAEFGTGTSVRTVFRLSPKATVFAIDPFRGRLAIYDPSLSVLVTQNLPTLGLPFRAEAMVDARNLFDFQTGAVGEAGDVRLAGQRRAIRGGILVRF